ncbi:small terminase protein [Pantoea phage Phynn]|nr:small terminase protein [Pantoea phage Phynn]
MSELNLSELLNIEGLPGGVEGEEVVVYEKMELVEVESHPSQRNKDLEEDYALARKTTHYMNQMLMSMAEIALHNAKNSESPRHVEAFTSLIGQLQNSTQGFMKLHKEMKEITEEKTPVTPGQSTDDKPNMNIENATVFVGSPTELMKQVGSAYDTKPEKPVIDAQDAEVIENDNDSTGNESGV